MSKRTLILAAACLAAPVQAQVTVTHAMHEAGLNLTGTNTFFETLSSTQLLALAAQTGASQTWDFTGLTYAPGEAIQVSPAVPPVPGSSDPHLAQATHIVRHVADDSTFYIFHLLAPTEAGGLGLAGPTILIKYLPQARNAIIPFTFGSTWSASYETQFEPPIVGATFNTSSTAEVVGWGTLVTPAGSASALMVRVESTTTISFPPFPPIINNVTQVLFTDYGNMNASIHIPQGQPASGEYNVFTPGTANAPPPDEVGLALDLDGANPVRAGQAVRLSYVLDAPAQTRIEVLDGLGRRMWSSGIEPRSAGTHRVTWSDPSAVAGTYVARLIAADGRTASRPFTILR
jgi:hypothetical protein